MTEGTGALQAGGTVGRGRRGEPCGVFGDSREGELLGHRKLVRRGWGCVTQAGPGTSSFWEGLSKCPELLKGSRQ